MNSYDHEVTPSPTVRRRSPRIRVIAVVVGALLLGVTLPACSSSSGSSNGTKLTIPVLWAGTDSKGEPIGGIENATVAVAQVDDPGFSVDLRSVYAKKAGPQWLAATSSAAAVATILSASDPATIDIKYGITGAIDGPSGGAILTVGTLAAIRGESLLSGVTMTGTISPDGSVGQISGVPSKLRGAAKAGFKKVLLPMANLKSSGEPSTSDMVAYGSTLGLEVKGVHDIADAYGEFTGNVITPDTTQTYVDAPSVLDAGTVTAVSLLARLDAELAQTPASANMSAIRAQRDQMRATLAAGRPAEAYGIGYDAYTRLIEETALAECDSQRSIADDATIRSALVTEAASIRALADSVLTTESQVESLDPVAQLSVPFALGWTTYADAIAAGVDASFNGSSPPSPSSYCRIAAALAQARVEIEVFQADAMSIVRATPNPAVTTIRPPTEFLSDYTNFLIGAGNANKDYFETVIRRGSTTMTSPTGEPAYLPLALNVLAESNASTPPESQTISEEIIQSANAITYFAIGVGLVSNTQSFGIIAAGANNDASSTSDDSALRNSISIASVNVNNYAIALSARSVVTGPAAWSARWGTQAADALAAGDRALAGQVNALNELWYDVVNCAVLFAATKSN